MYQFISTDGDIIETTDGIGVSMFHQYRTLPITGISQFDGMKFVVKERLNLMLGECQIFYLDYDDTTALQGWKGDITFVHWTGYETIIYLNEAEEIEINHPLDDLD